MRELAIAAVDVAPALETAPGSPTALRRSWRAPRRRPQHCHRVGCASGCCQRRLCDRRARQRRRRELWSSPQRPRGRRGFDRPAFGAGFDTRGSQAVTPTLSLLQQGDLHGHLSLSASPSWSASSRAVTILAGRPLDSHPRPLRRQRVQRAALGDLAGAHDRPRPPPQGRPVAVAALCMMRLVLSAAQIPPTGSCSGGVGPHTAPAQAGRQGRLSRVNIAPTGLPSGQASGGGAALVRRRPTGDRGLSHR